MLPPMNFIACSNPCRALRWALLILLWTSYGARAEPDFIGADITSSVASPAQSLAEPEPAAIEAKISAAQAAELVRRKTGGQVMSVSRHQSANGVIYGVKVLNSGRMKVIQVDGQSGQLLNH